MGKQSHRLLFCFAGPGLSPGIDAGPRIDQRGSRGTVFIRVYRRHQQQQGARNLQCHRRSSRPSCRGLQRVYVFQRRHQHADHLLDRHGHGRGCVCPGPVPGQCGHPGPGRPDQRLGWYNGDDAVQLRKGTAVVDAIGQIGFDPGSEWGTGLTSTADNTLRRKAAVCAGDTNGGDVFPTPPSNGTAMRPIPSTAWARIRPTAPA